MGGKVRMHTHQVTAAFVADLQHPPDKKVRQGLGSSCVITESPSQLSLRDGAAKTQCGGGTGRSRQRAQIEKGEAGGRWGGNENAGHGLLCDVGNAQVLFVDRLGCVHNHG